MADSLEDIEGVDGADAFHGTAGTVGPEIEARQVPVVGSEREWYGDCEGFTRGDNKNDPRRGKENAMLVLTCDIQDGLKLGSEISVTILDVRGGQVRLGIEAPKRIEVHREEIYRRIRGVEADEAAPDDLLASNRRLYRRKRRIIHNPTPY
jgi:carbon storage regulator